MKTRFLVLAFSALLLGSCTTAYKTGQTPDDVYYSPLRPQDEAKEDRREEDRYRYDDTYYDDRYLRMKVRNRYQWSNLDDWYFTDRYSIGYNYYYGSFNNPFNRWNYYYNPYCCCLNNYNYTFVNPKTPVAQPVVRKYFNLAGYTNNTYNNTNSNYRGMIKTSTTRTSSISTYNNRNNSSQGDGLSNKVRTIFSNDNSGSRSSRSYTPSSSSGSSGSSRSSSGSTGSSGSSGSGSGGVSRPTRN